MYLLIANSIAVFHGLVLIPLLVLAPWVFWLSPRRYKWLEATFALAAIATILNTVLLNYCLLSQWEYFFRSKIDPSTFYSDGFVVEWMRKFGIYWTEDMTIWIGGFFIAVGLLGLIKSYKNYNFLAASAAARATDSE